MNFIAGRWEEQNCLLAGCEFLQPHLGLIPPFLFCLWLLWGIFNKSLGFSHLILKDAKIATGRHPALHGSFLVFFKGVQQSSWVVPVQLFKGREPKGSLGTSLIANHTNGSHCSQSALVSPANFLIIRFKVPLYLLTNKFACGWPTNAGST